MLVAFAGLILILNDVLLLQLAHALDLVQVHNKALFVAVERLDALAAEDVQVVTAVEVLDALGVLLTQLFSKAVLVFILEVETGTGQNGVLLDHFIQDVDVEGESLSTLEVLDELAADRAAHTVLVVQLLDAVRAESVSTVHQDAGDSLAHIVLEGAELTNVKSTGLVVEVHQGGTHLTYLVCFY